jgi:hypothetical protein
MKEAGLEGMTPSCMPSRSDPCDVLTLGVAAFVEASTATEAATTSIVGIGAGGETFESPLGSLAWAGVVANVIASMAGLARLYGSWAGCSRPNMVSTRGASNRGVSHDIGSHHSGTGPVSSRSSATENGSRYTTTHTPYTSRRTLCIKIIIPPILIAIDGSSWVFSLLETHPPSLSGACHRFLNTSFLIPCSSCS